MGRKERAERRSRQEAQRAGDGGRRLGTGWRSLWPVVLPMALALLTYRDALHGRFVFDDVPTVVENASLETIGGFWDAAFGERHSPISNRPLVCLTFALNYQFGGLDPFGYHLVNLLIHTANAGLLWLLLRRMFVAPNLGESFSGRRATLTASAVAMLWASHPLASEAVVYITQRTTLMMSFFLLLMLYGAARSATAVVGKGAWSALTVVSCACAMLCKEEAAAAPLLLILFDRAFSFPSYAAMLERRLRLYLGAAAAWFLLIFCVAMGPSNPTVGYNSVPQVNAIEWLYTQAPVLQRYLQLTVWPTPLVAAYDWDIIRSIGPALVPGTIVLALLALTGFLLVRRPEWGFAGAWFFLLLAPTSSIMPIISEIVAERRMYLPMLSVLVPITIGVLTLIAKLMRSPAENREYAAWMIAPMVVIAIVGASASAERARAFDTEAALWTDIVQKNALTNNGFICGNILNGYAKVLLDQARYDEAFPILQRAMNCEPPNIDAYVNYAAALVDKGLLSAAEPIYREALVRKPDHPNLLSNFAKLRLDQYQADAADKQLGPNDPRMLEAYDMLKKAISLNPRTANYYNNLGSVCFHLQRIQEADQAWLTALQLDPGNMGAASNRAIVLAATGRSGEAIAQFQALLQRDPRNVAVLINLAKTYHEAGNPAMAMQYVHQALAVDQNNPTARAMLQMLTNPAGS